MVTCKSGCGKREHGLLFTSQLADEARGHRLKRKAFDPETPFNRGRTEAACRRRPSDGLGKTVKLQNESVASEREACTMKKTLVLMLLLSSSPAMAGSSAGYGMGGQFSRFDPVVKQYNQSGELFHIQGHCQSACTLFLGIRNVCIEPGAQLLFHAGHDQQRNVTASATAHLLSAYNSQLRSYVMANHYMDTLEFHAISGGDMIRKFGYPACPK
jgi:hypothetical protein